MNSQELRALQEAYSQVYELDESAIGDRARNAVADQRLDAAQGDTQQSVDKLGKREKVTRASAHIAAKKTETTARNMHPKPGTTGAYRITDSFDLYNIILSHLLDEGYVDTQEAAEAIIVNMSEDWRKEILDEAITSKKGTAKAAEMIAARTTASGRAKPGKGANVAQIRQISRSNIEGLGGTPMTPTMARNPVKKKNYFGTGNKAARRAGTYQEEVNNWVNSLIEEGYDLSEYSWDDMYEMYIGEVKGIEGRINPNTGKSFYGLDSGLAMTPNMRMATRANSLEKRGKGKRANKIRAVMNRPSMEAVDLYDIILSHLLDEGYADTNENALVIMANMSEDWRESIVEARMDPRGRPASGPMNVYANPKGKPDQAHLDAIKSYDEKQNKKTPGQRKAELDAYTERQMNNK